MRETSNNLVILGRSIDYRPILKVCKAVKRPRSMTEDFPHQRPLRLGAARDERQNDFTTQHLN
jgi:hypothetical protein